MSHSSEPQDREAALDGVKGASKPLANSAQNRERHIGGHPSGDGPIDPAAAPAGPAPGAQRREVPPPPPAAPDEHLIGLIEKPRTRSCPARTPEPHDLGEFPMTCYHCHLEVDS